MLQRDGREEAPARGGAPAARAARPQVQPREPRGREPRHAGRLQDDPPGGRVQRLGAAARRERHRQGAGRAGAPPEQPAARPSPSCAWTAPRCPRRCSRASSSATRRARSPARVYTPRRPLRGGRRRHALPRRDRRDLAHRPGQAAALPAGARVRARGRQPDLKVDVRIVAATNRDLQPEARGRQLPRGPLLPPERDRGDDPAAARARRRHPAAGAALPAQVRGGERQDASRFTDEALALLLQHRWPGNVRELENAIERAVVLADGDELTPVHFPTLRPVAGPEQPAAAHAKRGGDPRQHARRRSSARRSCARSRPWAAAPPARRPCSTSARARSSTSSRSTSRPARSSRTTEARARKGLHGHVQAPRGTGQAGRRDPRRSPATTSSRCCCRRSRPGSRSCA